MSSKNRVQVKMVRIQWPDKKNPISHQNDVTVGIPKDPDTNSVYLRISVNQKTIISEELNNFKWLDEFCVDGVATINSSSMKVIIIYDSNSRELRDFFVEMRNFLKPETGRRPSEPSPPSVIEQTELAINDLVKYIESGSSSEAVLSAKYLAQSRANVEFNIISHNDNEKTETKTKKSKAEASPNILQLQLHVECHLNKNPLIATIYVRSGTDLRSLKGQIENETGISRKDQYWYAFDRYLISDNYEFGSDDPVVPPLPPNAPKKLAPPPRDPIRSGDTLIMCIAQIPPFK